jgi:hypothetical protein
MASQDDRNRLGELLRQRLLSGSDLTVTSEIAEAFQLPLIKTLNSIFTNLPDPHLVTTAVNDALLDFFEHPTRFDPSRASLFTYLRWRAASYLRNSLSGRQYSLPKDKVVELDDPRAVYKLESREVDAETSLISREFQAGVIEKLRRIFTDPVDLRVVALMIEGVRETSAYAEALGVADRPLDEQKRFVKQVKDRINKIFERKFRDKERGR